MPLSDKQKEALQNMSEEERSELLEALGSKGNADLAKSVEILQTEFAKFRKSAERKGNEERRKSGKSWFQEFFGG